MKYGAIQRKRIAIFALLIIGAAMSSATADANTPRYYFPDLFIGYQTEEEVRE